MSPPISTASAKNSEWDSVRPYIQLWETSTLFNVTFLESVWAKNVIRSESAPVNSFPRNTSQDHADDVSWVFETSSSQWSVSSLSVAFCLVNDVWQCGSKYWIGEKAADQLTHHSGSYSLVVPDTNLRYEFARPLADCNH